MSYTYILGWSNLDRFYYGVRIAYKTSPIEDLWVDYFTSSKEVKKIVKEYGNPDIIKIDKIFNLPKDAIDYEHSYILENQLHKNPKWLNRACWPVLTIGPITDEHRRNLSESHKGKKNSPESIEKRTIKQTGQIRSSDARKRMSDGCKNRDRTLEHCENLSKALKGKSPPNKGKKEDPLVTAKRAALLVGRKMSVESSRKKSEKMMGRISPNTGNSYKMTTEQIARRQETRKRNAELAGRKY